MSDIVERLDEPEAHYPGNFDTPKRANAMLSCLCQEAKDEIESLRQQLAEKDAEIERLKSSPPNKREALRYVISDLCRQVRERNQQLAASQAREAQLREALIGLYRLDEIEHQRYSGDGDVCSEVQLARQALALPQDTPLLEAMIAKAGEVMRGQCESMLRYQGGGNLGLLRTLPSVTLEDLQ